MVRQIGVQDLAARMAAGDRIVLVDVRQPWEHAIAALPGSVLIPLDELSERGDEIEAPEGVTVVAYCHHGVRSLSAAVLLAGMGHADVVSLRGGIDAWSRHVDPALARY